MIYDINYWGVLVAAVATVALGGLWYSPLLFGNSWIKWMGFSEHQVAEMKKKGMIVPYLLYFVGALVTSFVMGNLIYILGGTTVNENIAVGAFVWLGFVPPMIMGVALWEGKPWKLVAINSLYYLVAFIVMAAIFTTMP